MGSASGRTTVGAATGAAAAGRFSTGLKTGAAGVGEGPAGLAAGTGAATGDGFVAATGAATGTERGAAGAATMGASGFFRSARVLAAVSPSFFGAFFALTASLAVAFFAGAFFFSTGVFTAAAFLAVLGADFFLASVMGLWCPFPRVFLGPRGSLRRRAPRGRPPSALRLGPGPKWL